MRRFGAQVAVLLIVVGLAAVVIGAAAEKSAKKGEEVTLTGKLSCTFCTLSHPGMPCPPGCCVKCIKAGDPPLLTDGEGNMYILLTNEMQGTLMTAERLDMVDGQVSVKGLLVKGKGIQAIFVDSVEKVAKK